MDKDAIAQHGVDIPVKKILTLDIVRFIDLHPEAQEAVVRKFEDLQERLVGGDFTDDVLR